MDNLDRLIDRIARCGVVYVVHSDTGVIDTLTLDEYFQALKTEDMLPCVDPNIAEMHAQRIRARLLRS